MANADRRPYADIVREAEGTSAIASHNTLELKSVILPALAQGQAPNLTLSVGPIPTLHGPGGTFVNSDSLFIVKTTPARQAAAWRFIDWFEQPAQQARWHRLSGFLPDRRAAASDPAVISLWNQYPQLAAAWTLATNGTPWSTPSIVGPLREFPLQFFGDAVAAPLAGRSTVQQTLSADAASANQAIAAYNAKPAEYGRCLSVTTTTTTAKC